MLNTWTPEPSLPAPEYGAAGVVDDNSNLDLIGGFGSAGTAISTVEYTPVAASTVALPQPPVLGLGTYSGSTSAYNTYDGAPQDITATAVDPTYRQPIAGTFTFTYNGSSTPPTNAGTYNVIAYFTSGDPNYVDSAIAGTYTIGPAYPAITVTGGGTFTYNAQPHPITATEVGIDGVTPVAGTFSYNYSGSSTAPTTWGTYTAVATFTSTNPNYSNATSSAVTITIPDPRIPTGVTVTGATPSSVTVSWNPVTLPSGATPLYNVTQQIWHNGTHSPKGSGGTPGYYTYSQVATNVSGNSITVGSGPSSAEVGYYTYEVASVDPSTTPASVSPNSALATGQSAFAPSMWGALWGGALTTQASVEVGDSVQITPVCYASPTPLFSLTGGTPSMSIDPNTGTVTYSPVQGESGNVNITITGTNALGTASQNFTFTIIQRPTVVVTGGTFSYDGNVHAATAVAEDPSGDPIAGTFSFQYQPVGINVWSTASYVSPGTYNVEATFTSSTPGWGSATGSGTQIITASTLQVLSFPGPIGYIGLDSTGTNLIQTGFINGSGSFSNSYPVSSFDTIHSTGSYLGTNLEIDLTNGNPIPVNGLTFAGGDVPNANTITIVDNSGNADTIVASDGQIIVNGRVITYTTVGNIMVQTTGAASLNVQSGSVEIPPNGGAGIAVANFSDITIGAGASLDVMASTGTSPRTVVTTASLSIAGTAGAWTGSIDLNNNDLIITNSAATAAQSLSDVTSQVASGYDVGLWDGPGITSTAAATDTTHLTTLGVSPGSSGGTFDGVAVDANAVLVKYTYYGDASMNGQVDSTDYTLLDNGSLLGMTGWSNGDFNYDGVINGSDFTLIDNGFSSQGAKIAAQVASPSSASSATATPTNIIAAASTAGDDLKKQKHQPLLTF